MDKQSFFQTDERPESLLWTLAQMEQDLDRVGKRKTARSAPDRLWRVNVGGVELLRLSEVDGDSLAVVRPLSLVNFQIVRY